MRRRRLFLAAAALPAVPALLGGCETGAPPAPPQQPFVVFFTEDSAALGDSAAAVVRDAAAAAKSDQRAPVTVLGYAGPAGGQAYNRALSEARARRVADDLVAQGVATSRITIRGRGPTPFEMMPTESRRVEIRVGAA
jgi:outer membrane protein OmpA-like peptidoglycan-associated protein